MKKIINVILALAMVATLFSGCSSSKEITTVETGKAEFVAYGWFDKDAKANPNIQYELVIGNIGGMVLI